MKDCSATADNVVVLPVPEFVSDTDSLVCLLGGVMLESGDRGLNPSHCTVECDWASHSYTLPLSPSSMIWYCSVSWSSKQAHHATRCPRVPRPAALAGAWLRAGESELGFSTGQMA